MKLRLHGYWRSSASHRVRIGLGLKELAYDTLAVNLLAREQDGTAFRARNPLGRVPLLEVVEDDGTTLTLTQSLAILEYLDERFPGKPLLPADPFSRARVRAIAEIVNSAVQPYQNLSALAKITALGGDANAWAKDWIAQGLAAIELAVDDTGPFCVGSHATIADCCLIPQLVGARRFGVDVAGFRRLLSIETRCLAMPAFAGAAPEAQPDAVSDARK